MRNTFRLSKTSHRRGSVRKGVLKTFTNFSGKHLCWSLFLIKALGLQLYEKETPIQGFSCDIYESFKNAYFEEHLR